MRVFITGARGFLGTSLAGFLAARGHEVYGSSSRTLREAAPGLVQLRLGQRVDPGLFVGMDAVVHCAFDLSPGARRSNVEGTIAIAESAKIAGVGSQIFISSYSAHPGALTEYGKTKLELEAHFLSAGLAAVRPGLVIGRGGLYARIAAVVCRGWAVPVVCPDSLVPVISVGDFVLCLTVMIEQGVSGLMRLYLDERPSMRELVAAIRDGAGGHAILVPVPSSVAVVAISLLEAIGWTPPLKRENILGLRANQHITEPGDLRRFVSTPQTLQEMIDIARC